MPLPWAGTIAARLTVAALALLGAVAAHAQTIAFRPSSVADQPVAFTTTSGEVHFDILLVNDGAVTVNVLLSVRPTVTDDGTPCAPAASAGCTLAWYVDGKAIVVRQEVTLDAGSSKLVTFQGRADKVGGYWGEIAAHAGGAGVVPIRSSVRVTRALANPGTGAIVVTSGTRHMLGSVNGMGVVPVTITNGATTPITFKNPLAILSSDDGGGGYATRVDGAPIPCLSLGAKQAGTVTLAPSDVLECDVALPSLSAGRYRARVMLADSGITRSSATGDFVVRLSWIFPTLLLLAGGFLGALYASYQSSGRRRMLQSATAQNLSARYAEFVDHLDATNSDSLTQAKADIGWLDQAAETLRTTQSADLADGLSVRDARLPQLQRFAVLEAQARAASVLRDPLIAPLYTAALAAVRATDMAPAPGALDALHDALVAKANMTARTAPDGTSVGSDFLLSWRRGRSAAFLLRRVRQLDTVINVFSIVLATVIGVAGLWATNPSWGGLNDFIVAFLTGLAGTATSATGLSSLVQGYTLPKVASAP